MPATALRLLQTVMPGMLEVLSGYVNKNPFGQRALTLLGKFGGRSHAHIKGPQPIEYYHSLDKGLRPVFVFKPGTSCLVPLDVCINLLLEETWQPSEPDKHYREQAFKFVASCLSRVLNMDQVSDKSNTPVDEQLTSLLAQTNIKLSQNSSWSGNGKTSQQYIAEEKVVEVRVMFISPMLEGIILSRCTVRSPSRGAVYRSTGCRCSCRTWWLE